MHAGPRVSFAVARDVALVLAVATNVAGVARRARADETEGRFGYDLELRGNGFEQRSSRVVVPEAELAVTAPDGTRFSGSYLVDVIASASVAQAGGDEGETFTELRHGGEVGVEHELEAGELPLTLRGSVGLSVEDDYTAVRVFESQSLALDERNVVLRLELGASRDAIGSNLDPDFRESLTGVLVRASVERVLHPRIVVSAGYGLAWLQGFQSNAYRRVLVGPLPYPERHPTDRLRHEVSVRLSAALPRTDTAVHAGAGAYVDSWDIVALSPELRVCQPLADALVLQAHYRFYAQTGAYFFRASYPAGVTGPVTGDPKMTALRTHTFGGGVELELAALVSGVEATLDLGLERYLSTSSYGDGWLATVGYRMAVR